MNGFRLSVDYGTSHTVAVLRWPDGRTRTLLFDSSPLLLSAVFAAPDGRLVTGRDAERAARADPARYEPNPKRRVIDGAVLLGDRSVPVTDLIAATLRVVAGEATRVAGELPGDVVLTYPAEWAAIRRTVLVEAAEAAGLPRPRLVPEPVAAAAYFATVLGHRVGPGQVVVVYDLGGGTLDVSAVRRTPDGYEVAAVEGMPDFGGLDLDAVVVDLLAGHVDPAAWSRLTRPATMADRRAFRALWDDARAAKETLSRQANASVLLPSVGRDLQVGREEFEAAARGVLSRSAELTATVVRRHGGGDRLAGLFLVGGSTRIPLVATMLHQATGVAPTALEQPELVVAEGALHAVGAGWQEQVAPSPVRSDGAQVDGSAGPAHAVVRSPDADPGVPTRAGSPRVVAPASPPASDRAPSKTAQEVSEAALSPGTAPDSAPVKTRGPSVAPRRRGRARAVAGTLLVLSLVGGGVYWAFPDKVRSVVGIRPTTAGGPRSGKVGATPAGPTYDHKVDLCAGMDFAPVRALASQMVSGPIPSDPRDMGSAAMTTCTATLMVPGTTSVLVVQINATVFRDQESARSTYVTARSGGDAEDSGPVSDVGVEAAYVYRPERGRSSQYTLAAVHGNLCLRISLTNAGTPEPRPRAEFDGPASQLARQALTLLPKT
ncbi:Hsp70 family protein [Longispora sp. NPDC051575]|uniref:Hsp70 family protein n=1 Tax=Longispora sp. NPDC051575 TaxID=3154943 RepID=UPI003414F671